MLPTEGRRPKFVGRIGAELDVEAGHKAARLAAHNALAVARRHLGSLRLAEQFVMEATEMFNSRNDTALVTDVSTGIGAVYADRPACRGYDLILITAGQYERRFTVDSENYSHDGPQ